MPACFCFFLFVSNRKKAIQITYELYNTILFFFYGYLQLFMYVIITDLQMYGTYVRTRAWGWNPLPQVLFRFAYLYRSVHA